MNGNLGQKQYRITLKPIGVTLQADAGQTIMDVLSGANIVIRSDCGCMGKCGKCMVSVSPFEKLSPPTCAEAKWAKQKKEFSHMRLACQAKVQGDITVTLPAWGQAGEPVLIKHDTTGHFSISPSVKRVVVDGAQAPKFFTRGSVEDFYSWIRRQAELDCNAPVFFGGLEVMRRLSQPGTRNGLNTLVIHDRFGVTAAFREVHMRSTGLAVDIGTTSIAGYLCDFNTGDILATAGTLNPQHSVGDDVMGRIAYACRRPEGLRHLHSLVIKGVNQVLDACLEKAGIDRENVDEMTVVGNPTMQALFAGLHPHSLGYAPFEPFRRSPMNIRAEEVGCNLKDGTNIYVFPVVSGFIGGDTLGCVLSDRTYERNHTTLIMDIGTNGELVLGNHSGLWATSCATGPALEGAHISCGMRAARGAIYAADIDSETKAFVCRVFGEREGATARGFCGSGIVDMVAAMIRIGMIQSSGKLVCDLCSLPLSTNPANRRVVVFPCDATSDHQEIAITAKDIRQVQLAKAAIATGIELLKRRSGIAAIDRIVITGAFGSTFRSESAYTVGLLPQDASCARLEVVPNAAGLGAVRALLNRKRRNEIESLYQTIQTLEMATDPDFESTFVEKIPFSEPPTIKMKGDYQYGP